MEWIFGLWNYESGVVVVVVSILFVGKDVWEVKEEYFDVEMKLMEIYEFL